MPVTSPLLGYEQPTSCFRHPAPRSIFILGRSLEGLWRGPSEEIGCPSLRAHLVDLKHHPQKANRLFHWIHRSILLSQLTLQGFGEALALTCCSLWNYSQYSILFSSCQGSVRKFKSALNSAYIPVARAICCCGLPLRQRLAGDQTAAPG